MNKMKIFASTILFCLVLTLMIGCGGEKKITVTGADGTEYESYQECCAANDYEAAHKYLAKMENDEDFRSDLYSAKEYVFKQEALFLMSQDDETAKKRIIYLLKEEGSGNDRINMLIELAIDSDDEDFVKSLTKQYKGSPSTTILRKIVEFLYIQKGEDNLDFVTTLLNRYNQSGLLLDAAVEKGNEEQIISLAQQFNGTLTLQSFKNVMDYLTSEKSPNYQRLFDLLAPKVNNQNGLLDYALDRDDINRVLYYINQNDADVNDSRIRSYLISKDSKQAANLILKSLPSLNIQRPPLGIKTFYGYGGSDTADFEEQCKNYKDAVIERNKVIIKLLNDAIANKNHFLASSAVQRVTPNIDVEKIGFVDRVHYKYRISLDNNDINSAKSLLNEAVRSGAFK